MRNKPYWDDEPPTVTGGSPLKNLDGSTVYDHFIINNHSKYHQNVNKTWRGLSRASDCMSGPRSLSELGLVLHYQLFIIGIISPSLRGKSNGMLGVQEPCNPITALSSLAIPLFPKTSSKVLQFDFQEEETIRGTKTNQ